MITVKNIESRLKTIDYTKPNPPRELLEELVSDGRSRILKYAKTEGLCRLSSKYFEFCLSQVGSFCTAPYNAVEIALATGMQPIYIAAAINLYGSDWAHKFFGLKRFAQEERGEYTVWKSADAWFALGECQNRTKESPGSISTGQAHIRLAVRKGDLDFIRYNAQHFPHRMMSILAPRKELLYKDPRIEKSKAKREAAKQAAAEAGKKLAEPGAFNDMGNVFNPAITRPIDTEERSPYTY